MALRVFTTNDVSGKKVLLRVDLNSPVIGRKIVDSPRLSEAAESIKALQRVNASVIVLAHQGRKGKEDCLPLRQHAQLLRKKGVRVKYVGDVFGERAISVVKRLKEGRVVLLENVRFFADEMVKKSRYETLCAACDVYVNDAFSVSHRVQGSIVLPPRFLPSFMGTHFAAELESADAFLERKRGGVIYLLGGSKVEDYLSLFSVLKQKENSILASGVLGNLLLIAKGVYLGYEQEWLKKRGHLKLIPQLRALWNKYSQQIVLPVDFAVDAHGRKEIDISELPSDKKIMDVGHMTVELFKQKLSGARSVFMKGPLGFSELDGFAYATVEILQEIARVSRGGVYSLIGGGHLTTTIARDKITGFSHISSSGGALIAYLAGEELPGIEALKKGIN